MGLFGLQRKTDRQRKAEEERRRARREDLDIYPGMRMEVATGDGRMVLSAELIDLRGDRARLRPHMDGNLLTRSDAPVPVTIRGRSSRGKGAVVLEATLRSGSNNTWQAEHLKLIKRTDNRASFRMDVDLEATVSAAGQPEEPCRLLNISTGGACIGMETRHNVGDKLLMRVGLLSETEHSALPCQILRIDEHRHEYFVYGCRFLDLKAEDENWVLRSIFQYQRQQR